MNMPNKTTKPSALSLGAIFLAFLAMGFGDASGQLVSVVEKAFEVSPFQASFISFAGMIMFGVLSIPMGVVQSKIGKKKMLLVGLLLFLLGAIFPICTFNFYAILFAVLLMGAGATILQVSGNPLMRDVSAEGKYSSNLSFAQAIKAIGTLSTSLIIFLVGTKLMQYEWFSLHAHNGTIINAGFRLLFPIFALILLITLLMVLVFVPNRNIEDEKATTLSQCLKCLSDPYILLMFLGIFFYCGAEATLFNRIPSILDNNTTYSAASGNIVLIVSLFVGRLLGGVVLRRFKPVYCLFAIILLSILGNIIFLFPYHSVFTWIAIFLMGIGFANIFPLIFSMTIDKKPQYANEISGLMVTAIVGAAIVPILSGAVAEINIIYPFVVTLGCLAYISLVAFKNLK